MAFFRKQARAFILFTFLSMVCSVMSKYKLKDLEFNIKPGDPPSKIFTAKEIAEYDGSDQEKPIYMAVRGVVFDVSSGRRFYGKGSDYNALVGKDASRGVAQMSLDPQDLTHDLTGLDSDTLKSLDEIYEGTYLEKYPVVGYMDYIAEKYADKLQPKTEL
ncbi:hypothetical protein ACOMHN_057683 [Nucella lapillus]